MDTVIKSILLPSRRMTQEGETPLPEALDTQDTMKQFLSDRILKAAKAVYCALIERNPGLIRDRKHHLKTYRQCCSGKELVDWLMKLNECFQSRSQAVGMWQVLVDEGIIVHVKQEFNFHDKDTQLYRFMDSEFGLNQLTNEKDPVTHMAKEKLLINHTTNEKDQSDDDLQEGLSLLLQMGPDALLTMILRKCPSQRSAEDLEVIYEELLHVKAVAHLSTSVRKELAAVLVFESHAKAGTVLFSQGDKGTSWYIIWKGSVNVITHGKGLVTTLHEGEDFGQLALVNDAPRAATIILREDNCHFLRVDKQDFIRILKDVEANTVRLEEHGKAVLVLEKTESTSQGGGGTNSKYTVMSGTPEKILEHLLETVKLDANSNDAIDPCVTDFLLTHRVFMPSSQLCPALQHHYHSEPSEGSELEKAAYALNTKQKIVKLIGQWVALFGQFLKDDPIAVDFLERVRQEVAGDTRLSSMLKEQLRDKRKTRVLENGFGSLTKLNHQFDWFTSCEETMGNCPPIRPQDTVLYELFRPDHTSVTVVLPVISSVQDLLSSLVNPGGGHILVKINSMGDRVQLKLNATGVYTSLGLNERLFLCTASQVDQLTPLREQQGPEHSNTEFLEQMCSKDIAGQLTNYDWELFTAMHEVELVYYVFGQHNFPGTTTANLERFVHRFNQVQYWVVTEVCLCDDLVKRAMLLKKFIKIAAMLKEQKNLNSFFAVMFGLSNSAVQRLYKTWERVPSKTKRVYCAYERLMDPSRNHRAYRLAVAKLTPPYIPFMPLLLKDMTFMHEGNQNYTEKLVNFEKMRMIAKIVKIVRGCRSTPYVPSSPQKGLADRMFLETPSIRVSTYSEQSLPLRYSSNIRHYVQNFEVIDNQRKLTQLSRGLEC
ncbi:rap guanine nucleotide exchange factor 3 isoform X2 [Esox lucius]|uniref:Rap guanine nucleotide exchange factor (GEF) 3 n=1 Tax=Esox lucius TaxID=8010 RepID=A0A3P8XHF4_ESOLU|nr:rap guanine nucleotide exchange factor 3 isoform X2 [Esox lucius]XP_019907233.2 rap guanine nucleotide exchange factor 3 isoform X2 [Esox lucius]XP_034151903.1 rap guanine nucleotide exchange factor 3 isoform X2 [Esox lucius]